MGSYHKKAYYVKRFLVENGMNRVSFITNHKDSRLEVVSTEWRPQVEVIFVKEKGKTRNKQIIDIENFIAIKGAKALGNKLTSKKIKEINLIDSLPFEEPVPNQYMTKQEEDVDNVNNQHDIKLEITNEQSSKDNTEDGNNGEQITLEL